MGSSPHVVIFPFMAKGHTIPLLDFARLLHQRQITITIITTPANVPYVSSNLASSPQISIVSLPFPENIPEIPPGVESTDKLPSMSLFLPFIKATKLMQPSFEQAIQSLPHVTCIISDGFLGWTLDAATKFGIPRLVCYGMGYYSQVMSRNISIHGVFSGTECDDESVTQPNFPWIKLTRNDFNEPFNMRETKGPYFEFVMEQILATMKSYGIIMNSFYELETLFVDYWNQEGKPKAWSVGPLCLSQQVISQYKSNEKPTWLEWLDRKFELGQSVLYVAFGSQAEISHQQLTEIAIGLENSEVNFLWVRRQDGSDLDLGFEERVKERGILVREWVSQREILEHKAVQGHLTHCGWNSVMESICAKVPILALPLMADNHLNARLVSEEIKVGIKVETVDRTVKGLVNREGLAKSVRELMGGDMGKNVRENVKEHGERAKEAMKEGGSSWNSLNQLIDEIHSLRQD